ncbi:MAG: hypothetical protein K2X81_06590, partial [Candidatus Obscuribacterales bacterium]|nr:hypothetical protein [Candidatus Obscuribacterales bacterium]
MSEDSKQKVLDAIKKLKCRVTAADVSGETGINLAMTNVLLNQVASETGSILEVSKQGTIVYRFVPNFESIYALQGIRLVLHRAWSVIFAVGFFLFQISFGVMLIVSMVIIVIAILVAIIAFLTGDKDGDSDGPSFNFFGGSGHSTGYNSSGDS